MMKTPEYPCPYDASSSSEFYMPSSQLGTPWFLSMLDQNLNIKSKAWIFMTKFSNNI